MTPLTDAEIEAIEKRCAAATPAPWESEMVLEPWDDDNGGEHHINTAKGELIAQTNYDTLCRKTDEATFKTSAADAEFISHSRTDLPRLLDEVKAARKVVEAARKVPILMGYTDISVAKKAIFTGVFIELEAALSTYDGRP